MAIFDRKMLVVTILKPNPLEKPPIFSEKDTVCLNCTPDDCPDDCVGFVPSDGPYFPPPPPPYVTNDKYHMPFYFILMLCVLGAVFVFICYMFTLKRYRSNSRTRRNNLQQMNENREDFIDENLGPVVDHPIWYIRTIGLSQEIIDSITVFKYKKDESLIEGSDCSVCLTEFEEDESLRLLPKCSHAFHIPCIDTWLRSHKNCPLCRAPIVSNMDNVPQASNVVEVVSIMNIGGESGPNEVEAENGRQSDQLENLELSEEENHENLDNEEGRTMDLSMKIPRVVDERKKGVRVFSDLSEHRVKVNDELQPARRSVSMDSSTAQVIHNLAMNEINLGKIEGCSSSNDQLAERNKGSLDIMLKRGSKNSSLYKVMKSSSFGRSLQKVPISMKRSFSTSGKCSLPTTSRTQDLRQTM
ncbi:PREDICTED: RING-H2 finger protein ATL52-like [Nicotiana attenuata]|uniref:RING-type E3 ubiquitin transferase n=1 Tax=Nicotiana attenuata TaxID=49451 RepID=A0A1J6IAF7_NICAT|nr:PREDICTED: RING-H2 finger protein ATL52-like [Nicotiana attenuata]OIS95938.1 ring-h2 finger protein atl54 [Nicotiana attenuata]